MNVIIQSFNYGILIGALGGLSLGGFIGYTYNNIRLSSHRKDVTYFKTKDL